MGVAKVPPHDHLHQSQIACPKVPESIPPTPPRDWRPSFVKTPHRTSRWWASALDVAPRMSRTGVAKVPSHDHLHQSPIARPPETGVRDS